MPVGVAVRAPSSGFRIQLTLPPCHVRYHTELWDSRSTGLLWFLIIFPIPILISILSGTVW